MAYCLRFIRNLRSKKAEREITRGLSCQELDQAKLALIKVVQAESFSAELVLLRTGKVCPKQIQSLSPFLDSEGIIRVGGRLQNADWEFSQKHPILLPGKHAFTELLIRYTHEQNMHLPPQALRTLLFRDFWILSSRRVIRSILKRCVKCFRHNPIADPPLMGNLPIDRVNPAKPFSKCGVDFGGPYNITVSRRRGQTSQKVYICLFVCFVTKAVHLELATNLSTDKFMEAFRRFIARRGRVTDIYSDCGTNFIGANKYLTELQKLLVSESFNNEMANGLINKGVQWHFNAPSAPHMGGLWEAGIKSTKKLLQNVLGKTLLSYDEFYTLLTEVEAILNSRPLYQLSEDPNDMQPLTPAHFLVMEPQTILQTQDFAKVPNNRLSHYQFVLKLRQTFWKKWSQNYLNTQQQRMKWFIDKRPMQKGDLVLINDSPLPPLEWRLGRISKVCPGNDGTIRVAEVTTSRGVVTRPVVKLCILPSAND